MVDNMKQLLVDPVVFMQYTKQLAVRIPYEPVHVTMLVNSKLHILLFRDSKNLHVFLLCFFFPVGQCHIAFTFLHIWCHFVLHCLGLQFTPARDDLL